MRPSKLVPILIAAFTLAAALPGCSKDKPEEEVLVTAENIQEVGTVTEKHDNATVTFAVAPEGHVRALVKGPDGAPIDKNVTGTVTWKPVKAGAVGGTAPLVLDPKTGLMAATIPPLEDDLTEVKYDINVNEKPVKGALHVPPGGTPELEANAKVSVEAAASLKLPEGKKGPNGGVIQVVGEDTIEVVGDKGSGDVRVYFLDKDLKPVKVVPQKTVKIAIVTKTGPDTIILTPDPGGLYFAGKFTIIENPTKVTVAVTYKDTTDVVLCGWHPGKVVVVGAAAPVFVVFVASPWVVKVGGPTVIVHDDDDDDHIIYVGKGKGKWKGKGKKWKGFKFH
jgi:hypothetical protein